jgi:hypothetical protein
MLRRRSLLFVVFAALLCGNSSALFAQTNAQLQLTMIGHGTGPYYAPAGQTIQFKIQILNLGPSDVFLVRGEAFLDPDLSGNWQLNHSEELGNFHLTKLQSAIWTFDLQMPSHIRAQNVSNGVPQAELLVKIAYSTTEGQQENTNGPFLLSVPGAAFNQTDYAVYLILLGLAVVVFAVIIGRRMSRSRSIRKAHS